MHMQEHPDVPVVDNMEDLWKVAKLQKERKARETIASSFNGRSIRQT